MTIYNAAIIGASGYTAIELIRICLNHPNLNISYLVGNSTAGKEITEIYPHLEFNDLPKIVNLTEVNFNKIDVVFSCLPHGELQKFITNIPNSKIIIDVSADFRLSDPNNYRKFYNEEHQAKEFLEEAVYGLSEIKREEIKTKRIIACPGCYPTSILLPLLPLLTKLNSHEIIIDSKSGISGAGRKTTTSNLFAEVAHNAFIYNPSKHRHLAEIEENIQHEQEFSIQFTPHIIPTIRGIISTIYVKSDKKIDELKDDLKNFYKDDKFVRILAAEKSPNLKTVIGTNFCDINIFKSNNPNLKIIVSALDNLTKGSSGQAVQNFNLRFSLNEDTGLNFTSLFP